MPFKNMYEKARKAMSRNKNKGKKVDMKKATGLRNQLNTLRNKDE